MKEEAERKGQHEERQRAEEKEKERMILEKYGWENYDRRKKTLLEQVFNYTLSASLDGDKEKGYAIGGVGEQKCVVQIVNFAKDKYVLGAEIDVRMMSSKGFRIKTWGNQWFTYFTLGDEKINFTVTGNYGQVMERMQDAWGKAFAECPSEKREPF